MNTFFDGEGKRRMTVLMDLTKADYEAVFPSLPKNVFILNQRAET